jgi:hypothetical protein
VPKIELPKVTSKPIKAKKPKLIAVVETERSGEANSNQIRLPEVKTGYFSSRMKAIDD